MKLMRLTRGRDVVDLRGYPNFPTAAEDPEGKYVFHALESRSPATTADLRGRAVSVTDKQAEEMLTHPTGLFEEVTEEVEARDRYRSTLTRDMFGVMRDPRTGAAVDTTDPEAVSQAAVASAATGTPTPPDEVRDSVKRDLQNSGDGAKGTPEATGRKKAATE